MNPVEEKIKMPFTRDDFIRSIEGYVENYQEDIGHEEYFGFPLEAVLRIENTLLSTQFKNIAYFSMEYGIAPSIYNSFKFKKKMSDNNKFFMHEVFSNYWLCDYLFKVKIDKMLDIPIYGGGLGVLAGDSIKSAADQGYPMAGIGILWNKGYFKQRFWYKHGQVPEELTWDPFSYPGLIPLKNIITIDTLEGTLHLRLWKYYVYSYDKKNACPVILLDSNLPQNQGKFRKLTDQLYRSDDVWWKIFQRIILGIGGMKAIQSLGYHIERFHLNEGHAAMAILEKYVHLENKEEMEKLKDAFVYTCHTPVEAGHDRFPVDDISKVLKDGYVQAAKKFGQESPSSQQINLTWMCLNYCHKVNAVAQKHGEIMRLQFPQFASKVKAITNGVHLHTWLSESFQQLFDKYKETFGDWRASPKNLINITQLKEHQEFRRDLFLAHQINKRNLINIVKRWQLKEEVFTLCWARRIAAYKRPSLIFHDTKQIVQLAYNVGPIQIILAGKAHPNDNIAASHVEEILDHIDQLNEHKDLIRVLILENYDTYFGKLLTNSVDVWLNNPLPPFEASGTSGMKAILNGVIQVSTLDGWVVEAGQHDIGWVFGYQHQGPHIGSEHQLRLDEDSKALYNVLQEAMKLYYKTYQKGQIALDSLWIDKMIHCIEQGAFFNTQRMIEQYKNEMW